jgi:tetratricopeptide (TPR) repeat protein
LGELDKAVDYYHRTSVIMESLLQNDPNNADHRYGWAYSVQLIAETQALKGGVEQASILVDQAISVFDELKAFDENNKEWLRASARAWLLKGQLYAAHGELEKARTIAADSIILLESLITQEASDLVITRVQLVNAYHLLSLCEQMSGNFTAALEANQKAFDHMQSVQNLGRLNNDRLGQFALVIATQGQINAVLGETELANASWTRATSMLEERIHSTRSPLLLDPWFRVLVFSGSEQAANKVLARLKSQGYQPLQRWPDTAH